MPAADRKRPSFGNIPSAAGQSTTPDGWPRRLQGVAALPVAILLEPETLRRPTDVGSVCRECRTTAMNTRIFVAGQRDGPASDQQRELGPACVVAAGRQHDHWGVSFTEPGVARSR